MALSRRKPLLTSAFIIALALTVVFAAKAAFHYTYWTDIRQQEVMRWMSPNYISRVWMLDIDDIEERLNLDMKDQKRRSIARIARERGDNVSEYIEAIEALIIDEFGAPPS